MPINKLLKLPYGSYLMVRLDYKLICNDELEAKIMRIIEMYMDIDRMIIYREMLNNPQNAIDPNAETKVTKDVWVAISHRLFKNDLYDQDMSENTLKRALKSLAKKKFIRVRDDRTKRYEAPKYQINTDVVQAELNTLSKLGKTEYQKLMVSNFDTIKISSRQILTPADHQNLTVSSNSMVSKFDPNSRRVTNTVKDTEEEGTSREQNSNEHSVANATTPAPAKEKIMYSLDQGLPQPWENEPYRPDFSAGQQGKPAPETKSEQDSVTTPELSTLTGTSPQTSAKVGPVDIQTLTIAAHVNYAFKWLDAVRQKAEKNPQASYVQNKTASGLIRNLIESTMNTPNELTEQNIYIAWMAMWKSPTGKDGFTWGEPGKISIAAFCRNYGEYLARGQASLAKAAQGKAAQSDGSETGVSGLKRWRAPGTTQAALAQ